MDKETEGERERKKGKGRGDKGCTVKECYFKKKKDRGGAELGN